MGAGFFVGGLRRLTVGGLLPSGRLKYQYITTLGEIIDYFGEIIVL
ncbi:hypothetical protein [Fictibacillus arsenicus]|nr:hypothetical protein [Fictibacillus arsenicus]